MMDSSAMSWIIFFRNFWRFAGDDKFLKDRDLKQIFDRPWKMREAQKSLFDLKTVYQTPEEAFRGSP